MDGCGHMHQNHQENMANMVSFQKRMHDRHIRLAYEIDDP